MSVTGLVCLTILIMTQCGCAHASSVSQLSVVRVQPGLSTSLKCQTELDEHSYLFWIKIPFNEAPVCIATVKTFRDDVSVCKPFEKHSRIKVTWDKKTFNLSFSSVEETDVAAYFCGTYNFGEFYFGKGHKLILEEQADAVSPNITIRDDEEKEEKRQVFDYLLPALAASSALSILIVIWLCLLLKKNRSGNLDYREKGPPGLLTVHSIRDGEVEDAGDKKTDEVNYAALTFGNKQRRTVQKRTNVETTVIYGAVQHQGEL